MKNAHDMPNARDDEDLLPLVLSASVEDLGILCGYITDDGKGRISLDNAVMSTLVAASARGKFTEQEKRLIVREIQLFGGNTFLNIGRGKGILYREIVEDVASRLKVTYASGDPVSILENAILVTLAGRAWEKMTDEEKRDFVNSSGLDMNIGIGPAALTAIIAAIRASGFAAYKLAAVLANTVARQLLGRGLAFGAAAPFLQGMSVLAGPIGWAITAVWSAYDFASPGYRVTVPCVIHLAYMRKKMLSLVCAGCGAPNAPEAKFCSECGHRLQVIAM
jgi:uncharacterized protein YaaW (UPF0174 family)